MLWIASHVCTHTLTGMAHIYPWMRQRRWLISCCNFLTEDLRLKTRGSRMGTSLNISVEDRSNSNVSILCYEQCPLLTLCDVITSHWWGTHTISFLFYCVFTGTSQNPFLRRAVNYGTRITGQLRQPTTSLHTWPITWDIKGCLCLF